MEKLRKLSLNYPCNPSYLEHRELIPQKNEKNLHKLFHVEVVSGNNEDSDQPVPPQSDQSSLFNIVIRVLTFIDGIFL